MRIIFRGRRQMGGPNMFIFKQMGHVVMPSLSLWTAWCVCNSELTILFLDLGGALFIYEADQGY